MPSAETGRILLQLSFLYPSSSHCFTPSPSQMNTTDLALAPHPTPSKSICKTSVFTPPETISLHVAGYFYLLGSGPFCLASQLVFFFTEDLSKSLVVHCSESLFSHVIDNHKQFPINSRRHKALGCKIHNNKTTEKQPACSAKFASPKSRNAAVHFPLRSQLSVSLEDNVCGFFKSSG